MKLVPGFPSRKIKIEDLDSLPLGFFLSNSPQNLFVVRRYNGKDSQVNLFHDCGSIYDDLMEIMKDGTFGKHKLNCVGKIGM